MNQNKRVHNKNYTSIALTALIMFVLWILLSWCFDPMLLGIGVFCCLLVAFWSHDLLIGDVDLGLACKRMWRLIKYLPWLMWQIFLSNLTLVYLTLHPRNLIEPTVITLDPHLETNMGVVTFANSITLTPGTVTVEANKNCFVVHAITRELADDVLNGDMLKRVKAIERG
ncbi:MAG: Na+/H+ antiporter subunit E [Syntrophomonadaceae bacterium]|jgi:multicomponent Na+:H+ antiporter subunit E